MPLVGRFGEAIISTLTMGNSVRRVIAACVVSTLVAASAPAQSLPNGVAAGDVDQETGLLWARATTPGVLLFEYSSHSNFQLTIPVQVAVSDPSVPVKIAIPVRENTQYYYRATDAAGARNEGTFRTPAADGYHGLRFGVSGDWRGELAPYPSVSNAPDRRLDFFVALGDTVYADMPSIDFPGGQARTLEEFRTKHNEVYGERFGGNWITRLRESTAFFVAIDDHEVTNDFSGGAPPESDPRFDQTGAFINETQLFNNGLQAFQEYNPVHDEFYGETGDPRTANKRKLYRFRRYGHDAAIFLLDARSFRDEGLPELLTLPTLWEFQAYMEASFDDSRTMLGEVQLQELMDGLLFAEAEGITWKFVLVPEPIQNLGPILASDRFEGYAYERSRLLSFINRNDIHNVVFVAADIHATIVNDLTYQLNPLEGQIASTAFEITTGSVAYAAPFGPTVLAFTPELLQGFYGRLDQAGRINFVRNAGNALLSLYGYPWIGLESSPIDAQLLQGGYLAVSTFGWTEFEIDAASQCLMVTTYGIQWYDRDDLFEEPDEVLSREPRIVSQFRVEPDLFRESADLDPEETNCNKPPRACGGLGLVGWTAIGFWLMGFLSPPLRLQMTRAKPYNVPSKESSV
jgi:phosphodiesterase/alkaline phosphatase D-like protein